MPDKSGRRRHSAAVEIDVAVRRRSGWRIRRLFLDEMVIEDVKDDEDCESGVNVPITLITSPSLFTWLDTVRQSA